MAKKKNIILSFFSSVTLTIILLSLITFLSLLGTLIPQREAAEKLIADLNPELLSLLQTLQVFDIYHSIWFIILLLLLLVNLTVCSANRFPTAWKQFRRASEPIKPEAFEDQVSDVFVYTKGLPQEKAPLVENLLSKKYRRLQRCDTEKGVLFYAARGAMSYFGVYIVHLSLLLILCGVILGSIWGFKAYVEIAEGEIVDRIILKGSKGIRPLDFAIRCDRFYLENYEDGTPKSYRSDLTILREDKIIKNGSVFVNHPLDFEGLRFYQASYGRIDGDKSLLIIKKGEDKIADLRAVLGATLFLSEKKAHIEVIRAEENFMGMGPAVKINIKTPADHFQLWIFQAIERMKKETQGLFKKAPLFNPDLYKPYSFSLEPTGMVYYTGLQVNYDPGLFIIGAGAFLLVFGFLWVFFYDHREIWIRLEEEKGGTRIGLTGRSNKRHAGLTRDIAKLFEEIEKSEDKND